MKKIQVSLFTRIFFVTILLLGFGILMIYSASVSEALRDFGSKWHFVSLQLERAGIGLVLLLVGSFIPPRLWQKAAPYLMLGGLGLLLLVLIPGLGIKVQGARRWLNLPGFSLQPAELIKLIEIIYLSSWLKARRVTLGQFLMFLVTVGGLIMLEPDMGTTIVVSLIAVSIYFLAESPISHLVSLGAIGLVTGALLIFLAPYRLARLETFFNPDNDPSGASYHIRQVVLALGSGGISGVGIGRSRQKYEYLPESTTDSIFAVVGEELGFLGGVGLIALFTYLVTLIFKVATLSKNTFSSLVTAGIGTWLTIQVALNLSAMVALAPLTGVPLPLVSYGGSALLTVLMGIGIVLSVARSERL